MTIAATLTRRMIDLGASPELIAVAVEAVTLASRDCHVTGHVTKRRSDDAARQRKRRKHLKMLREMEVAQANDGVTASANSHADGHVTVDEKRCDLSFLGERDSTVEGSKKQKKKVDGSARARGTRLQAGEPLSDTDRAAAINLGAHPDAVPGMWAEFLDFWIGVPGQRGLKCNWPATWRNRVRDVIAKGRRNGQQSNGYRANSATGPAQNGADAILAGMANVARKRGLLEPADGPKEREIQRRFDLAGQSDAD